MMQSMGSQRVGHGAVCLGRSSESWGRLKGRPHPAGRRLEPDPAGGLRLLCGLQQTRCTSVLRCPHGLGEPRCLCLLLAPSEHCSVILGSASVIYTQSYLRDHAKPWSALFFVTRVIRNCRYMEE